MKQYAFLLATVAITLPAQMGPMGGGGRGMHGRMMGSLPTAMTSDSNPITDAKVDLGRMLFYDPRLSVNNDVSCNSCHDLSQYGVDGHRVSDGHLKQKGNRNSPTVYNAAGHLAQFWDGRAADIEEQAKGPVLNPVEMAMPSAEEVVAKLQKIPGYVQAFQKAFPEAKGSPVTYDNMAKAIGAFERKLVTPNSRWDQFLNGKRDAITADEMAGHHEFMHGGCATCHNGPFVGGKAFQKLGAEKPWPSTTDEGRYAVTKAASDKMVFKVPSLRNVAKTGPYFHDGSVATLTEAVRLMGMHQLNTTLSDKQITQIVAWLNTLTGEIPKEYIRPPRLPQ